MDPFHGGTGLLHKLGRVKHHHRLALHHLRCRRSPHGAVQSARLGRDCLAVDAIVRVSVFAYRA